ncbi:AI-2E family transporter [Roseomonas sp. BN140053]|uniref:AI-2E family transporter n=1 Tax=Roseomonas sp. BN140053 TaxID=3391898 RepID=UPI0039E7AF76
MPITSLDRRRPVMATGGNPPGFTTLFGAALVVAAIYFGRDLFVPVVLAVLLAFVLAPVVRLLRMLRLGRALAVLIAVVLAFAVLLGIGLAVTKQAVQLVGNLSAYQAAIQQKIVSLHLDATLAQVNMMLRGMGNMGSGATEAVPVAVVVPAPAYGPADPSALDILRSVAEPLLKPLATTGIVIVFVIFVLLYREDLRDRLIRLAGARDLHRTMAAMNDAAYRLSRFFLTQVALNASYGLVIGGGLTLIGLPNPVLWGIVAGVMRFVPFVGNFFAVVPPLLLALAVDPGWTTAISVLLLFVLTWPLMGQVLEPLLYGHSTGLSPISVIVAATFWAWIWGPVGLLLSTPLTVCLVVLGRHVDRLEFLEVMLGDRPPLLPAETFYQRALEGDTDGLVAQAKQHLREGSLSAYYDEVAMGGLALAQGDRSRDVLEADRLQGLRQQVQTLMEDLKAEDELLPEGSATPRIAAATAVALPVPPSWARDGAVLCIAGRGEFDDLGAEMAAQVFQRHGFGARAEPGTVLETAGPGVLDPERIRLCCLSVLEDGNSAAAVRHFLRRLRRRIPGVKIIIGLWHASPDSPVLTALRAEGPGETIMTSLREAVTLCEALMALAERQGTDGPLPPPPATGEIREVTA